ncbi:MAG: hypothetical protein ABSC95_23815 [Acetobacteraceae bacterium]|jgi:hypothetical protein
MTQSDAESCFDGRGQAVQNRIKKCTVWNQRRDPAQFCKDGLVAVFGEAAEFKAGAAGYPGRPARVCGWNYLAFQ